MLVFPAASAAVAAAVAAASKPVKWSINPMFRYLYVKEKSTFMLKPAFFFFFKFYFLKKKKKKLGGKGGGFVSYSCGWLMNNNLE